MLNNSDKRNRMILFKFTFNFFSYSNLFTNILCQDLTFFKLRRLFGIH